MIVKSIKMSAELKILHSLNQRMELSESNKARIRTLQKGYEGELLFESYLSRLQNNYLVLSDLFLQTNSTYFQLDSLLITEDSIFLFEVKNHEGDYYYDSTRERISSATKEITNPISQVERSETLLRQVLQAQRIQLPLIYNVVFVNPEFMLYNSPINKPIIYPTQINRYLKQFDNKSINKPNKNRFVAERLLALHSSDAQFWQIPPYKFEELKKGVSCVNCRFLTISVDGYSCVCSVCSYREPVTVAILRCTKEFQLLFPEMKITTGRIFEWCDGIVSTRTILRTLERNFKKLGISRSMYFI